jgi:hypothetical protein
VQPPPSASIALCCVESNLMRQTPFTFLHFPRRAQGKGDPQITPISPI